VVATERAEALDVLVARFAAGTGGDVIDGALGVDRVVEDAGVDDQAECIELRQLAPSFAAVERGQRFKDRLAAVGGVELDRVNSSGR
jgi:hypothetical protein